MRLERAEFFNFCQHRHIAVDFHPGLTAIIGTNGSGKSNFLGGIKWLITGDNPNPGPLEDNICQLAGETERSMGSLIFSHSSTRVRITRHLRPEGKATLEVFGADNQVVKTIKGDKNIGPWLEDFLGISFDILKEMVIVSQDDIFAFLDMTPTKRAAAFQKLFRTEAAGALYELIGKQLTQVQQIPLAASAGDCRINITRCEESLHSWEEHSSRLRQRAMVQAARDTAVKVIGNYEAYNGTRQAVAAEELRLQDAKAREAPVLAERDRLQQRVNELTAARAAQAAVVEAAKTALNNLETARNIENSRRTVTDNLERCRNELANLVEPPRPANYEVKAVRDANLTTCRDKVSQMRRDLGQWNLAGIQRELDRVRTELANLNRPTPPAGYREAAVRQAELEEMVTALQPIRRLTGTFKDDVAECPTCGTPVVTLQAKLAEAWQCINEREAALSSFRAFNEECETYERDKPAYEPKLRALQQQEEQMESLLIIAQSLPEAVASMEAAGVVAADGERYEQAVAKHQADKQAATSAVQNWEQQLAALPPPTTIEVDETALRAVLTADAGYGTEIWRTSQPLLEQNNALSRLRGEIDSIEQTLARRRETLAQAVDVSDAEATQAQEQVTQLEAELAAIDEAANNVSRARDSVNYWQQMLATAEQAEAASHRTQQAIQYGTELRDLFHHSNAPRFVAHRNLQRLQGTVNALLGVFQARYQVVPDQGLSFTGHFTDGVVQRAARFSHGEAVVLATAFRLANNLMFAEHIGLLALDEPTAYLDEHHIRGFEPVLTQLRGFAAARGLQCVIITHERSLGPLFDTVIAL